MHVKPKHRELVAHYLKFADNQRPATDDEIRAFIDWESRGVRSETDIARILEGKRSKELTIKMIYEEVFYYWSQFWGWALPLIPFIDDEFIDDDDPIASDPIMRGNCRKIFKTLETRGVASVLTGHSEFGSEQKERWLTMRAQSLNRVTTH